MLLTYPRSAVYLTTLNPLQNFGVHRAQEATLPPNLKLGSFFVMVRLQAWKLDTGILFMTGRIAWPVALVQWLCSLKMKK